MDSLTIGNHLKGIKRMKVLVIGKGGREHAMVRALSQSPEVAQVFAMPGSDGISKIAICLSDVSKSPEDLVAQVKKNAVDLVVVGPEVPLVNGVASALRESNVLVVGPNKEPAKLEGSKIFAKEFMREFSIPTADAVTVKSVAETEKAMAQFKPPYVLKADGLASGKGVFICKDKVELLKAAQDIFERKTLGPAGSQALLEQSLLGYELSVFVLVTETGHAVLPFFRDHKRLLDGDRGPNTGGMGVIGPIEVDQKLLREINAKIIEPSVAGIQKKGWTYRGLLYIGVMVVDSEPAETKLNGADGRKPYVLEYNVRFGDPEAQCIFPLLDGDWAKVFYKVARGEVSELAWKKLFATCVVVAAPGYPDFPKKGEKILGDLYRETVGAYLLHAGTKKQESNWVSDGGRVLNAVGLGGSQAESMTKAYQLVDSIIWPGKVFRKDIGRT